MSDFLDFYKQEEMKRSMTEEQLLELHKKQKAFKAKRFESAEDDAFYNEECDEDVDDEFDDDLRIDEGVRAPSRPARPRPAPQPVPRPVPSPQPAEPSKPRIRRPVQPPRPEPVPEEPNDDLYITPPKRHGVKIDELNNNPALSKAYTMMNEMQKKIETAFYRYGMSGLEKINKHLDKIFEAIVNPKPKEVVKYVEKPVERIIEKPVYVHSDNKPYDDELPTENDDIVNTNEQVDIPVSDEEPIDEQAMLKQKFIKMNELADSSLLSDALLLQNEEQAKTANTKLAQIEANAQLLREKLDNGNKKSETPKLSEEMLVENDDITPSEDLEIVDDPVVDAPVEIVKAPEKSTKTTKKKSTKKSK